MTRALGQIDDATARALVLHFGLKGAIDYATKIFQMGGPLAKEYGWLADYLTTYKAATEDFLLTERSIGIPRETR